MRQRRNCKGFWWNWDMNELTFAPLTDFADIAMGQSPGAETCNTDNIGLPFLQGCAEFGRRNPATDIYCSPPLRIGRANATLISVRAPVGTMNYADKDYCIGRGLAAFKSKPGVANNIFLKHAVEQGLGFLHRRSQGSTFAAVSSDDIRTFPIPNFGISNQNAIALILTSIDTAIEKTEALITKYQQIKAGLMHDLLTRGVLPNGKLRPSREQAPELYQELGEVAIPKEWETKTLGTSCIWYSGGTPSKLNESFWNGPLPWLSPKDMKQFELADTQDHVTRQAAYFGSRIAPAGTVFIVVRGMILAHSFPVVFSAAEFSFNQDVKAVAGCPPLSNRYLAYWFVANTNLFLKKTTESTHGTKRFDLSDLYKIAIGVPTPGEQQRIIERLDTLEQRIANGTAQRDKLRLQKLGLMQDLLTGKVEVKADVESRETVDG
jgi:type I restriction enzyme, S subunit